MTRDRFDLLLREGAKRVAADPTGPCPSSEQLLALYAGRSSEDESEAIGEHLATCERCFLEAIAAQRFAAAMREQPEHVAAHRRSRTLAAPLLGVAAAILVAAGLALYFARAGRPEATIEIAKAPFEATELDPDALLYRSAGGLDPDVERSLETAMAPYRGDDFAAAESSLQAHLARHPTDQRARFYRAVSLLLLERDDDAMPLLEEVERMASPQLAVEARWYRSLALLRSGRRDAARAELQLIAQSGSARRQEALALLESMGTEQLP